jgi:hypothetical protein
MAPIVWAGFLMISGCRSAHEVASSSYNTAAAPVSTTTVTTTTIQDGSTAPVESRARPSPRPERTAVTSAETKPASTETKPRAESTPRPAPSELDFPTAKPVEGKPGYVYSPFDPGKYVDVSGYAPGSKVKDPYSGKIFKVP